jgi:hypothetical protein
MNVKHVASCEDTLQNSTKYIYYACNYLYHSERFQERDDNIQETYTTKKIQQHDRGLLPSVADPVMLWVLGENFVGGVSI